MRWQVLSNALIAVRTLLGIVALAAGSMTAVAVAVADDAQPGTQPSAQAGQSSDKPPAGDAQSAPLDVLEVDAETTRKIAEAKIKEPTEAIQKNPKDAKLFRERGQVWAEQREFQKAIDDYNAALQLEPNHVEALVLRGAAKLNSGQFDKAIEDLSEAIRLDPKKSVAYQG